MGSFWLGRLSGKNQSQSVEQKDNQPPRYNSPKPNSSPDPLFPSDQNKLTFNCSYFAELGKSYIYAVHNSNKTILIDKKTHFILNDNFAVMIKVLNPTNPGSRSEKKLAYIGEGEGNNFVFSNTVYFDETTPEDFAVLFISKNHPQTKKLLSQGKVQIGKNFIIRYGTPN
ncbi:3915_t:CDS:2 [Entrophospora sp. SA101]|nr:3915_t:CDS:2 [Entrophospora sp. SA101]CAJ0855901.1 17297_t:CDS:2 [Entrophospora sp. SA101]